MRNNWSDKELLKYYEEILKKGIVHKKGSAYNRMLEVKEKLEKKLHKKRIEKMRKANKLIQSKKEEK